MFHQYSLTRMIAGITNIMGVEAPRSAEPSIPLAEAFAEKALEGRKADRVLIYNPDCIGLWHYQKYTDLFIPVLLETQLTLPMAAVMPSVTPVCFGSMYTGAAPRVHGILQYEKRIIRTDSFFDALPRAGKKAALAAVKNSSMAVIFGERPVDYYIGSYDDEVNETALRLIREDRHDVITVYNQEYDDLIHKTSPESEEALSALRHHVQTFARLAAAVRKCWKDHDTMIVFAPDHGNHYEPDGHGNHGEYCEEDININHYYGFIRRNGLS